MEVKKPSFVTAEKWKGLNKKEKAFVFMLSERKYTQQDIMDKLYIESERTFRHYRLQISKKIQS